MITERLMEIGCILNNDEKGRKVVGGADPKYLTEGLGWLDFTHRNIMIRTKDGDLMFKVKKIDIFPSISGALNVGLTLDDNKQLDSLRVGDIVYKILDIDNIETP